MSTPVDEPIAWPRTLRLGTDMTWSIRRVVNDVPIIPTLAIAQLRDQVDGEVWLEWSSLEANSAMPRVIIDSVDGWMHFMTPHTVTETIEWNSRFGGVWDAEWVVDGRRLRLVEASPVTISPDITRED